MWSSAEMLLTSVINSLVRLGYAAGLRITAGAGEEGRMDSSSPPHFVSHYLMKSSAPNQRHDPSKPLSQKLFKEQEGWEEERLWCTDENI